MINFNKTLKLLINGEEYDFSNNITFSFHPTNFSTITFNDVIAKKNNKFPLNIQNPNKVNREFTFAELWQDNQLIYFGIVNDTGRFSLFPNKLKTFSVVITDFRKFLSSTNPINKLYRNKTPQEIVNDVVEFLNEEKISIGKLNFTNNEPIQAYSSVNKNAYQILKNVITKLSNSFLYFTIENNKILINYKSEEDMKNISPIKLDSNDLQFLKTFKIKDIVFENETYDYANFLTYTSENIVSTFPTTEYDLLINENIYLKSKPITIDSDIEKTFIISQDGTKRKAIFLNEKNVTSGKIYDFLYNPENNILKSNESIRGQKLTITYYTKGKVTFQDKNSKEIVEISKISGTNGIVAKYDKFNDLSYSNDLLRQLKTDLEQFSSPNRKIIITSEEPIWELTDVVEVQFNIEEVDGLYLVHSVNGKSQIIGESGKMQEYEYELKQTKNFDNIINKFDNQSYRDEAIYNEEQFIEDTLTLFQYIDLKSKSKLFEAIEIKPTSSPLNNELNYYFYEQSSENIKYKIWKIGREN